MNPMKRWDEFQSLADLAEEYDGTYHLLLDRLNRLKTDPGADRFELRTLKDMVNTTREIRNVCRDYYKKGAWLPDAYTVRYTLQRTSGRSYRVDAGKRVVKRGFDPKAASKSRKSDSRRVDASTAADLAALLIQQPPGCGNCGTAGGQP